jgi:hypothetical protein
MHGRKGRKKLGGRKEIWPTFSDCARPVPKKLFVEEINFGDPQPHPPPSPKQFRSVYHFSGPKNFPDLQNFSEHQTPFPYITKLTTKLTSFVPVLFIISQYCPTVKRILPDCLCLPNKLGAFWLFHFPLFARLMLNICPTFRLCNLLGGGGQLPPCPPVPYAYG